MKALDVPVTNMTALKSHRLKLLNKQHKRKMAFIFLTGTRRKLLL